MARTVSEQLAYLEREFSQMMRELNEATELLERWDESGTAEVHRDGTSKLSRDTHAFLAQAGFVEPADCPACGHSEPRDCGAEDCPQPSAPEPTPTLMGQTSEQVCMRVLLERAESAEAQIAAVRSALTMPRYYVEKDPEYLLESEIAEIQSCLSDAFEVLTQPTPGAGTGEPR